MMNRMHKQTLLLLLVLASLLLPGGSREVCATTLNLHPSGTASDNDFSDWSGSSSSALDSNDGDSTYAKLGKDGTQVGRMELDNSSETGAISSVQIKVVMRERDSSYSDDQIRIGLRTGGSDYWGSTLTNISTSFTTYSGTSYTTNPKTGIAWTWTDINNLIVQVQNYNNRAEYRVTEMYAVVTYGGDATAPAAVSNLAAGSATSSSLNLTWTSPGDDGSTGTATSYDIRYRTDGAVTTSNWATSTLVSGEPLPSAAGTSESFTVTGLTASTTYYFAIKTSDEVPNESALSNSPSATTSAGGGAGGGVVILHPSSSASGDEMDKYYIGSNDSSSYASTALDTNDGSSSYGQLRDEYSPEARLNLDDTTQTGTITSVRIRAVLREKESRSGDQFRLGLKSGGNEYWGSVITGATTSYSTYSGTSYTVNPSTNNAWSWSEVNALVALVDNYNQYSEYWITELWAEVSYEVAGGSSVSLHPSGASSGDEMYVYEGATAPTALDTNDGDTTRGKLDNNYTHEARLEIDDTALSGSILSVQVKAVMREYGTSYSDDQFRIGLKTGGTEYWGSVITNAATSYTSYAGSVYTTNPKTGLNWTWSDINALAALVDNYNGYAEYRISELWVVVNYDASDVTAPSAVNNLVAGSPTSSSITLTWTAPGDDGGTGTASSYDIRYRTGGAVTDANWAAATQVVGEPGPAGAGSAESFTVTGLSPGTTYHFAIKTADEIPNWSSLSNSHNAATVAIDSLAPAAVTDLTVVEAGTTTLILNWTAPGDDGYTGTAAVYDLRYSTSAITDANWAAATQATGEPAPGIAGTAETFTVTGLSPETTYYFAIKTIDEKPNTSAVSNSPSGLTQAGDLAPPSTITDLATGAVTTSSIALSWTAPGDDGMSGRAAHYDLRYSTSAITDANWSSATQVAGEPAPAEAGSVEGLTVTGLTAGTTYYFAVKAADEAGNWTNLSNVPSAATTGVPDVTAPSAITDLEVGITGVNSIQLTWTAPGDDEGSGTAVSYDIRYSTSAITDANWGSATEVGGEPAPLTAGSPEVFTVQGLDEATTYYFAVKASDETPNESGLSNVVSGLTDTCGGGGGNQTLLLYPSGRASDDDMDQYYSGGSDSDSYASTALDTSNGDTSYGKLSDSSSYEARLEMDNTAQTGTIVSVQIKAVMRDEEGSSSDQARIGLKTNGSEYWGGILSNVPTSYTSYSGTLYATNPNTGSAWTWSQVNALVAMVDNYNGSVKYRITQLYAEVIYNEGAGGACGSQVSLHPSGAASGDEMYSYTSSAASNLDTNDGDSSYGKLDNDSSKEARLELDNSADLGTITSVQIKAVLKDYSSSSSDQFRLGLKTGGTEYWGSTISNASTSYTTYAGSTYNLNPQTTTYWSWADINALAALVDNYNGYCEYRITELWAVVSYTATDTTAPAAITNLAVSSPTLTSVTLTWTAPGDDGSTGTAALYDIRYSTAAITDANWVNATQVLGEPVPSVAGSAETFTLTGLSPEKTYYFAIKSRDDIPNISNLSNVPSGTTSTPAVPHHIRIEHNGSGLTCQRSEVTLRICGDSDCSTLYPYPTQVTLSPATGWLGGATFTVQGGVANMQLRKTTPGTVALGLSATSRTPTNGTQCYLGGGLGNCNLSFYDSGFIFDVPTQDSCDTSAPVTIQAVRTDATTYACVGSESFSGKTKSVKFWSSYLIPASGTKQVKINGTSVATSAPGTAVNLSFDAEAKATFTARYDDAGSVQLDVRYDGVGAEETSLVMLGSDAFTTAPHHFKLTATTNGTTALNNSGSTGAPSWKAGENFYLKVEAVCADDTTLNPNYAADVSLSAVGPFEPSGGILGSLTGGSIAAGAFSGGSATVNNLTYSEVGTFTIQADAPDYQGSGMDVSGTSGVVGRFTPDHFDVSLNTPAFDPTCGSFSYLGQKFDYLTAPVITVTARNKAGATTQNYTGSWWKLTSGSLTGKAYSAASGSLDTGLLPGTDPVVADSGGGVSILTFGSGGGLAFTRTTPVADFNAEISLAINVIDGDGVLYASNPAKFGNATAGNGISFGGAKSMRFGRLKLENAYGSDLTPLNVPLAAEYYNGSVWVTNSQDSCTSLALGDFSLTSALETVPGTSAVTVKAGSTSSATLTGISAGIGGVSMSAPSPAAEGYISLTPNLSSLYWLRFDWDGNGTHDNNPTGRATFGVFKGNDKLIFIRESVQ